MATRVRPVAPVQHLDIRIAQNLADAEQWRAEHGDPGTAKGTFLNDWIGVEALEAPCREYLRHDNSVVFDDYDDDAEDDRAIDMDDRGTD
jgi:hypothetical protein